MQNKLRGYYFTNKYKAIKPALVLIFNDAKHPVMPIREYCWHEYLPLLKNEKYMGIINN